MDKEDIVCVLCTQTGFPGGSVIEKPPANAGDSSSIPGREEPLE